MKPIRVLLADDHSLVRAGIRALLQGLQWVEVVAEAGDGFEALEMMKTHQPDVALVDIAMPGLGGLEATARAAKAFPDVRVIILSMHGNEEYVLQALRAGAAGYGLKNGDAAELGNAVVAVARGQTYLAPAVSKVIVDYVRYADRKVKQNGPEPARSGRLTPRQRVVLKLIVEGHTVKEIAYTLGLSVKTVETHRAKLMDRLNIHGVAGLVRYAIRTGLVMPDG